ncbi:DUF2711 family protein [Kordia algicida OT-1]|uniref:Uncharacterized protein n=1 Tax=Kordia algicida OT-1 TaxID=391587 RepID=A9E669_9FLAO|nr:DUF2711 family protein [Kordia algicida]EDP94982.1 hypothetical protein KAOT1_01564 [Kordia algicida OT-1]
MNKSLYPDEKTPLLAHFSEYDSVYIGLIPFFKVDKKDHHTNSSKKIISFEEAQKEDEIFENIQNHSNMTIYVSNEDYPSDEEIIENGNVVTWEEIISNTKLENYKELNKALMTSIGAFHKKLQRKDLLELLNQYAEKENIWNPTEGMFDYFTKSSIFNLLTAAGITKIETEDEFCENKSTLDLKTLNKTDFCEQVDTRDYYIYTKNKSIFFAIGWDFFFFFIAIDESKFSKKLIESHFEGFWADEKTTHLWTWEEGEIDRILNSNKTANSNKSTLWTKLKRLWS